MDTLVLVVALVRQFFFGLVKKVNVDVRNADASVVDVEFLVEYSREITYDVLIRVDNNRLDYCKVRMIFFGDIFQDQEFKFNIYGENTTAILEVLKSLTPNLDTLVELQSSDKK